MEQEIVKKTCVNSPGQKAQYQRLSIEIIEAEVQQLIAASNVGTVRANDWQSETGDDGVISDGAE